MAVSQKINISFDPTVLTSGYIPRRKEITVSKRHSHPHVCCNISHNNQNMATTEMLTTDKWRKQT